MKSALKFRSFLLLLLLFSFLIPSTISALEPSLSFFQEADFSGIWEQKISAETSNLDGFILFKSSERLPDVHGKTYSFAATLKPAPCLAITGGAISLSGLPARARNPVCSITDPFYTPIIPFSGALVKRGTSKETGNLALELTRDNWKFVAAANPGKKLGEPGWILGSRLFQPKKSTGTVLSLSFFAGAHRIGAENEDSWFLSEQYRPAAILLFPAMEAVLANDFLTASCTTFLDTGRLRKPAGMCRSDISLSGKYISLAGGFSLADHDFVSLDGDPVPVIKRFFIAPEATVPLFFVDKTTLHFGIIGISDTARQEKYYEPDTSRLFYGAGFSLINPWIAFHLQMMKKQEGTGFSGSFIAGPGLYLPLRFESSAKTTIVTNACGQKKPIESRLAAGLIWFFSDTMQAGLEGSAERAAFDRATVLTGGAKFAAVFHARHSDWNFRTEISVPNDRALLEGEISLLTLFR